MEKPMSSLAQLQQEKERLLRERAICKEEFINSLHTTKKTTKDFLLYKVALPAGAVGLATMGIQKLTASTSEKTAPKSIQRSGHLFFNLLPVLLPLIQSYFGSTKKSEEL